MPRVGTDDTKIPEENHNFHAGDGAKNGAVDVNRGNLREIISQIKSLSTSQIEAILRIIKEGS